MDHDLPSGHHYTRPFDRFPSQYEHQERWAELTRAIAAAGPPGGDSGRSGRESCDEYGGAKGELTVLGSGIEAAGFTRADERLLREADHVFHCVADPATVVRINAWRPDAYDLGVLYDDAKDRYLTYVQMSEAVLHFVRAGRRVAAVFYGHPGIFVLSSHRAVRIARREGHRAVMRPGISALDVLCADLGVDPSTPGMQTFEASDLLIRGRRIDPSLHLVLWQVGVVGELDYQRAGFTNRHLPVLLDRLEEVYGPDHTVVNYIGARYRGLEPVTAEHTVAALRDPAVQRTVTSASTWYLAPTAAAPADPQVLRRLGLLQPGQTVRTPDGPLRTIDEYGPRERAALDGFADFRIPAAYHWQEDTPGARFVLALGEDSALRARYVREPAAAVADWAPPELGAAERALLSQREDLALQAAARGVRHRPTPEAARRLRTLLTRKSEARALLRDGITAWPSLRQDLESVLDDALYPWTGLYGTPDGELSVYVLGRATDPPRHRVHIDGRRIADPRYERGVLRWREPDGSGGELRTEFGRDGRRRLVGTVSATGVGGTAGSVTRAVRLTEYPLPETPPLADLVGGYRARGVQVDVVSDAPGALPRLHVSVDGEPVTAAVLLGPAGFEVTGFEVADFEVDAVTVPFDQSLPDVPPCLYGDYRLRLPSRPDTGAHLRVAVDGVTLDGQPVPKVGSSGRRLGWQDGPAPVPGAELTLLLDPITLHPMLHGTGRTADGTPFPLVGMVPVEAEAARRLAARPRFGIPPGPWAHLTALAAEAGQDGGLFWWHGWEQSATALRTVQLALWESER
ncbi:SAM-dependent methyltransferase [Kitasatospora sp. NPDC001309]|uniref:SAM-dependent methyltransferase n=1 Tax=Kitasatospora sp. NPDC001309 TaxID=3364013 RepID=UPI003682488C